jgi:hypothetical protein
MLLTMVFFVRACVGEFLITVKSPYVQLSSPDRQKGERLVAEGWVDGWMGGWVGRGMGGWVGLRNGWMGGVWCVRYGWIGGRKDGYKGGV